MNKKEIAEAQALIDAALNGSPNLDVEEVFPEKPPSAPPLCQCGHGRERHYIEQPYECSAAIGDGDVCDCDGYTIQPVPSGEKEGADADSRAK